MQRRGWRPILIFVVLWTAAFANLSSAQNVADEEEPAENAAEQMQAGDIRDLVLITKDRLKLACRIYAGTPSKQTIPLILLHGWNGPFGAGSGRDLESLALRLQEKGHTVAVPDLRGHGRSLTYENQPNSKPIDRDRFRAADFRDMMLDVEAVRSFLVRQNDAGRLNLELLGIIGFEMGSVVALNWIHYDWMVPSFPRLKQGQDAKAFVLVSPEQSFKGFAARPALTNQAIRSGLAAMIVYGESDPQSDASRRLYNTLRRSRRAVRKGAGDERARQLQDLVLLELETRLRGSKLLDAPALQVVDRIVDFIEDQLASQRENLQWRSRATQ